MEQLTANLSGKVRRETLLGRRYLVAPITLIVPGVLNGSKGPLLYPPDEVAKSTKAWDDQPMVLYHPYKDGRPVPVNTPGVLEESGLGFIRNSRFKDKLRADGWFDVEKTRRIAPDVLKSLEQGRPIELSTGLLTDNEPAQNGASHDGRPYAHVARNYRPDHLAILPDQVGACSLKDGCGVLVNRQEEPPMSESRKARFRHFRQTCNALGLIPERLLSGGWLAEGNGFTLNYSPNQPRDSRGRFGSGGGGGGKSKSKGKAGGGMGGGSFSKKTGIPDDPNAGSIYRDALKSEPGPQKWTSETEDATVIHDEDTGSLTLVPKGKHEPISLEGKVGKYLVHQGPGKGAPVVSHHETYAEAKAAAKQHNLTTAEPATVRSGVDSKYPQGTPLFKAATYGTHAPSAKQLGAMKSKLKSLNAQERIAMGKAMSKRATIQETGSALAYHGYKMEAGESRPTGVTYKLTDSKGKSSLMSPQEIRSLLKKLSNTMNHESRSGLSQTHNEGGHDMAQKTDAERKAIVDELIANVCCWEEKDRATLNGASDDVLVRLKETADKAKQAEAVANAAKKGAEELEANKPVVNALTAEQLEDIAFARGIKQERKAKAVAAITANAQNRFTKEQLDGMTLDVVENMAALLPVAKVEEKRPLVSYAGAAVPVGNAQADDPDDLLIVPTINWNEKD